MTVNYLNIKVASYLVVVLKLPLYCFRRSRGEKCHELCGTNEATFCYLSVSYCESIVEVF